MKVAAQIGSLLFFATSTPNVFLITNTTNGKTVRAALVLKK